MAKMDSEKSEHQTPAQLAAKAKKLRVERTKAVKDLPRQSAAELRKKAKAKLAPVSRQKKSTTDRGD